MNLIELAQPVLSNENLIKFKNYINTDKFNDARLLVENVMVNMDKDEPEHIILNEIYDELINEIEMSFDIIVDGGTGM